MVYEPSSLLRKARHNRRKAAYPWLRTVHGNPEKMLMQLDSRRDELLNDIPLDPYDLPDETIVEWLTLTAERDIVVCEIFVKRRKEAFDVETRRLYEALLHHQRLLADHPVDCLFPAVSAALNEAQEYLSKYCLLSHVEQLEVKILETEKEFLNVGVQTEDVTVEPQKSEAVFLCVTTQTENETELRQAEKDFFTVAVQTESFEEKCNEIEKEFLSTAMQTENLVELIIHDHEHSILSHSPVFDTKWKPVASSTPLGKHSKVPNEARKFDEVVLQDGEVRKELSIVEDDKENSFVDCLARENFSLSNSKLHRSTTCPEVLADLDGDVPARPNSAATNCLSMMSTCSTTSTFGLFQRSLSSQISIQPNFLPNVERLNMKRRLMLNNPLMSVPQVLPETVNESLEKSKSVNGNHDDSID